MEYAPLSPRKRAQLAGLDGAGDRLSGNSTLTLRPLTMPLYCSNFAVIRLRRLSASQTESLTATTCGAVDPDRAPSVGPLPAFASMTVPKPEQIAATDPDRLNPGRPISCFQAHEAEPSRGRLRSIAIQCANIGDPVSPKPRGRGQPTGREKAENWQSAASRHLAFG